MTLKIRLSPRAQHDLANIRAYIHERNPRAAERVRLRIVHTLDLLSDFPYLGRRSSKRGVLMTSVPRYGYRIYYAANDTELLVIHIRHPARQDPKVGEL